MGDGYMRSVLLFLTVVFAFSVNPVFADGSATSGGGGTHTCLNSDGSVKSTELYDLYEAREAYGYKLVDATGKTANQLLVQAVKKIWDAHPLLASQVVQKLVFYSTHKLFLKDKSWDVINDSKQVFIDKGCQYQQIAQWRDRYNTIFVDESLFKIFGLSELNRAALALHEAVYAFARMDGGDVISDGSRTLVAQAFSNAVIEYGNGYAEGGQLYSRSSLAKFLPGAPSRAAFPQQPIIPVPGKAYKVRAKVPATIADKIEIQLYNYYGANIKEKFKPGQTELEIDLTLNKINEYAFFVVGLQYQGFFWGNIHDANAITFEILENGNVLHELQPKLTQNCDPKNTTSACLGGVTFQLFYSDVFKDYIEPTLMSLTL